MNLFEKKRLVVGLSDSSHVNRPRIYCCIAQLSSVKLTSKQMKELNNTRDIKKELQKFYKNSKLKQHGAVLLLCR